MRIRIVCFGVALSACALGAIASIGAARPSGIDSATRVDALAAETVAGPPSIFRLLSRVSIDMRPLVLSSVGAGPIETAYAGGSAPSANLHVASGS